MIEHFLLLRNKGIFLFSMLREKYFSAEIYITNNEMGFEQHRLLILKTRRLQRNMLIDHRSELHPCSWFLKAGQYKKQFLLLRFLWQNLTHKVLLVEERPNKL